MAISLVQTKPGNAGNYSNVNAQTLDSNVILGNTLIISIVAGANDTIGSISGGGNTYQLITNYIVSGDRQLWLYYAENVNAGATTITVTYGSGQFPDSTVIVREYSGLATTSSLDKFAKSTNQSNYVQSHTTSASAATTQAEELVIVAGGSSGNTNPVFVAGSTYGNLVSQSGFDLYTYGMMEDKIVNATGTQTGTYSTSQFVIGMAILATFKAAATAPAPSTVLATLQSRSVGNFFNAL